MIMLVTITYEIYAESIAGFECHMINRFEQQVSSTRVYTTSYTFQYLHREHHIRVTKLKKNRFPESCRLMSDLKYADDAAILSNSS